MRKEGSGRMERNPRLNEPPNSYSQFAGVPFSSNFHKSSPINSPNEAEELRRAARDLYKPVDLRLWITRVQSIDQEIRRVSAKFVPCYWFVLPVQFSGLKIDTIHLSSQNTRGIRIFECCNFGSMQIIGILFQKLSARQFFAWNFCNLFATCLPNKTFLFYFIHFIIFEFKNNVSFER